MKKLLFLTVSCIVFVQQAAHAMSILHETAGDGDIAQVTALLNTEGTDVNQQGWRGRTPLHFAAWSGHEAVVRLLLEHMANVDLPDDFGYTPLHLAASNGHEAVVRLLLEQGANVDLPNNDGRTPLHCAEYAAYNDGEAIANDCEAVVCLLQEWPIMQQRLHAARIAILMGLHARTGACSPLCTVKNNVQQIFAYLQREHFSQAEVLQQRLRSCLRAARLAFCTGSQSRTGAGSSVRHISASNIEQIFAYLRPENYLPNT